MEGETETDREGEREKSVNWFTAQMAAMARAGLV